MIVPRGKVHACKKPHRFQDDAYDGGRVANPTSKVGAGSREYRCTVCSETFSVRSHDAAPAKKADAKEDAA